MEALRQALVLCPVQVIFSEVLEALLCAVQRDLLFVLAAAVVLLQLLVEDLAKLFNFTLLNTLIDLLVKRLLRALVIRSPKPLLLHVLPDVAQNALRVHFIDFIRPQKQIM